MKSMIIILILLGLLIALPAKAVCPVCTIAVTTGVGLCRWLGVDDSVSGVWIGGLCVSLIFWSLDWLKRKNFKFAMPGVISTIVVYLVVVLPLYFTGIMGHPLNKRWGMDKLMIGIIIGSIVFLIAVWLNEFLKKRNNGKVYFPYQKVVIPVLMLLASSYLVYLLICR